MAVCPDIVLIPQYWASCNNLSYLWFFGCDNGRTKQNDLEFFRSNSKNYVASRGHLLETSLLGKSTVRGGTMLIALFAYFLLGIVAVIAIFHFLPPEPGYRPPWAVWLFSVICLIALWPVILVLAVTYGIGYAYRCYIGEEPVGRRTFNPFLVRLNER